jgi:hypothetical protein
MAKKIQSTHIYAPHFSVSVQEYDEEQGGKLLLVRASSKAVLSMGFDIDPELAVELAEALTKHAKHLMQEVTA